MKKIRKNKKNNLKKFENVSKIFQKQMKIFQENNLNIFEKELAL